MTSQGLRGEERSCHFRGNFRLLINQCFPSSRTATPLQPPWAKAKEPLGGANDWLTFYSLISTTNCLHSPPSLGCRLRVFNYLHGNGWTRNCLPFKQFTEESNCVSSFHVEVLPCEGKGTSFNLPADRAVGESAALAQLPNSSHFKLKKIRWLLGFLYFPQLTVYRNHWRDPCHNECFSE